MLDADSGQPASLDSLKSGSTYQINVTYLGMTGTTFVRYSLAGTSANLRIVMKVRGPAPG